MADSMMKVSRDTARRFMLMKQGLLGAPRFEGEEGVYAYIRQAGSIQFDPINVCGRNTDLTLLSRVKDYRGAMLYNLLYNRRRLVDYFDKELCVFPTEDWPYFARVRALRAAWVKSRPEVMAARDGILQSIRERGPLTSRALDTGEKVDWFWGSARLSRAVLEHLFYAGDIGIHSKQGSAKTYDVIENLLPQALLQAPDPYPHLRDSHTSMIQRRAGAIGLVWKRASPAWLGLTDFKAPQRLEAFGTLTNEGALVEIMVDGLKDSFFVLEGDIPMLREAGRENGAPPRCEVLAPLDPMLWDRKLVHAIFGFEYTWEIYTPSEKRKYGYYVLPLLYGQRLVGRVEPVYDRKMGKLQIKGVWFEPDAPLGADLSSALDSCLGRLEAFHVALAEDNLR